MKKFLALVFYTLILTHFGFATETGSYGAGGASKLSVKALTIPRMLKFALEDEYLARGEYQKIMNKFGQRRPFSNIIEAEKRHIAMLLPLFKKYKVPVSPDRGLELAVIPATFSETFPIGVKAEEVNIEMYERFLKQKLPEDVRSVFERLLSGSQNHLAAFSRKRGGGRGRGRGKGRGRGNHSQNKITNHSFNIYVAKNNNNLLSKDIDLSEWTPLFSDKDLVSFDWSNQMFTVDPEVLKKINMNDHLYSNFTIFADKQRCYSGKFWTQFSSKSSSQPVILYNDPTKGIFKIQVNYPKNRLTSGSKDKRFDKRLKTALRGLNKLK